MTYQPSKTTEVLLDLLRSRDKLGSEKYGTSLDRTDLTPVDWAQHAVEELLDGAGYLVRWKETHDEEVKRLREEIEKAYREGFEDSYEDMVPEGTGPWPHRIEDMYSESRARRVAEGGE